MKTELLNPQNSALILIDFQPQMTFGVANIDRQTLFNNVMLLSKAAMIFNIPTVLTTVETKSFSGNFWPQVLDIFPDQEPVERSSMNSWDEPKLVEAVVATGRKKLIMAALWTEACLTFPALEAIKAGYEVYAVEDASGGTSVAAHNAVIEVVKEHGGAYGQGVEYAYTMVHGAHPSRAGAAGH
jgi:nicotinamidase-related amidase